MIPHTTVQKGFDQSFVPPWKSRTLGEAGIDIQPTVADENHSPLPLVIQENVSHPVGIPKPTLKLDVTCPPHSHEGRHLFIDDLLQRFT